MDRKLLRKHRSRDAKITQKKNYLTIMENRLRAYSGGVAEKF